MESQKENFSYLASGIPYRYDLGAIGDRGVYRGKATISFQEFAGM
jgi:hypothetical protein